MGPVYSACSSHDNKYILSCSEDKTGKKRGSGWANLGHSYLSPPPPLARPYLVRLWSTELKSNIVCYKGHNYPVWDVDFGPLGVYFASASYDRTARLWSCEHINPLRLFVGHLSDVNVKEPQLSTRANFSFAL